MRVILKDPLRASCYAVGLELEQERAGEDRLEGQEAQGLELSGTVVSESQRNTFSRRSLWQFHGSNGVSRIQCYFQALHRDGDQ